MGDVVARASQPALAAIKLAWWRERLEDLDQGKVPPEPRLRAAAAELLPRGIKGAELALLEAGWAELLSEEPETDKALDRGAMLFGLAARLLGVRSDSLAATGRLFAAGSWRRRSGTVPGALMATEMARFPPKMRPLTGLAALAKRDLERVEPEGTPVRAWTLLRHRLTGHI